MLISSGAIQSISRNALSIFLLVWLLVPASRASAQAPDSLSFQGFVTDPGGVPINNPGVSMTFKLYEGSSEIWSETQPSVKIVGGVFDVRLGAVIPLDTVRFDRPLSLGIKVGADPEISPRTPMAAAAYARALPGLYTFHREEGSRQSYNVIGGGLQTTSLVRESLGQRFSAEGVLVIWGHSQTVFLRISGRLAEALKIRRVASLRRLAEVSPTRRAVRTRRFLEALTTAPADVQVSPQVIMRKPIMKGHSFGTTGLS